VGSTIIVPLTGPDRDGDRTDELALPVARALAKHHGAAVILMSVIELPVPFAETVNTVDAALAKARDLYLRKVAETFPDVPVQITVRQDIDVAGQILDIVAESDDPIVILASRCRRGLSRALMGNIAFEVVHQAPCPVIVVPVTARQGGTITPTFRKVLVPLDGTPEAETALDAALHALDGLVMDIHLVGVLRHITVREGDTPRSRFDVPVTDGYLHDVADRLAATGYQVSCEIRTGSPEGEIPAAADEHDCDLIAMATRGRTGLRRFVLGSVAESILRDARRPLVLTRPTPERAAVVLGVEARAESDRLPERIDSVPVSEVMSAPVVSVGPDALVGDIADLMLARRLSCVPVIDAGRSLVGIISESDITGEPRARTRIRCAPTEIDLMRDVMSGQPAPAVAATAVRSARDIMTRPVITVKSDDTLGKAVALMVEHDIDHIPVTSGNEPVGVVSRRDLLRLITRQQAGQQRRTG
jgi:nucleotide-binding universal stress UspA family protein/predicted transcriptional regulator